MFIGREFRLASRWLALMLIRRTLQRANIGNAESGGMAADLGITSTQ